MTRRSAVMAFFAIVGQQLTTTRRDWSATNKDLTVVLGEGGFERFHFSRNGETVTFTTEELMTALKAER